MYQALFLNDSLGFLSFLILLCYSLSILQYKRFFRIWLSDSARSLYLSGMIRWDCLWPSLGIAHYFRSSLFCLCPCVLLGKAKRYGFILHSGSKPLSTWLYFWGYTASGLPGCDTLISEDYWHRSGKRYGRLLLFLLPHVLPKPYLTL